MAEYGDFFLRVFPHFFNTDYRQIAATIFNGIQRYSTVFDDATRRHSTVFNGIQRYSTVFNGIRRRHCTVFDGIQRYSMVFNGIRRFFDVIGTIH